MLGSRRINTRERRRRGSRAGWGCLLVFSLATAFSSAAVELVDAQQLFKTGKYAECIDACAEAIAAPRWGEGWWVLKLRAELTTGRYADALKTQALGLARYEDSIPLQLLAHDALRMNDKGDDAAALLAAMRVTAERSPWRYADSSSRVALGRALLLAGVDARQVLESFYDKAKRDNPDSVDPYLASGDLALEKHDYALAAEAFRDAAKRVDDDPDVYLGLARAYENDSERATASLAKALELNPRHVDSLLFQVDNLIDREDHEAAEAILKNVLEINPKQPRAWAYRAVLAHVAGDPKTEAACRAEALSAWTTNPEVDHLIGRKLSEKYRFAEGAARQRKALELAPAYRPAKVQLCNDLLRLGKEDEGWRLAAEVFEEDQYNVVSFNLVTLRDHLQKFTTLKSDHFLVRMDPREAQIYGDRVMRLLERARVKLADRYGVEITEPVTVEIFPQQQDFAIRTFGLPGGAGFLGVCFGPVVTVNSPASRMSHPSNWEAVLWHEFCHTVTLNKTRNKMPRWLSEGISVYEERREVPSWGQVMTPQYRELILSGGATPVSRLSGAFLKPPSPMHLQFAYYQSSMVVQYVVDRFGTAALQKVLADLALDVPINTALAKHTEPIEQLDEHFDKWFKEQAEKLAAKADWERPKLALDAGSAEMAEWNRDHPDNFWGLLGEGRALLAERKWEAAKKPLAKAIALHPTYAEAGGPYLLMAAAHRELGETKLEREMLEKHVALDADAVEPRLRLSEIAAAEKDWKAVRTVAEQVLAINPLIAAPHGYLVQAAEALGDRPLAIEGHRTLLLLDPLDRAEHHFRLAKLLAEDQKLPDARREVVRALEEAPRYRAAHALLLDIAGRMGTPPATGPSTTPAVTPPAVVPPAPKPEVRPQ
jgi:tetratricopeptide (TPR) repeat protein